MNDSKAQGGPLKKTKNKLLTSWKKPRILGKSLSLDPTDIKMINIHCNFYPNTCKI